MLEIAKMHCNKYLLVLFCALLAVLSQPAYAEFKSGNQLKAQLENWESTNPGIEGAIGVGYVVGVVDSRLGINYCLPSGVTLGQLTALVLKQLNDNPDKLHFSGDAHVVHILKNTWPCKDRKANTEDVPNSPVQSDTPRAKTKDQVKSPF